MTDPLPDSLNAQLRLRLYDEMRHAAEQLYTDYASDTELTAMTALDGEEFTNALAGTPLKFGFANFREAGGLGHPYRGDPQSASNCRAKNLAREGSTPSGENQW